MANVYCSILVHLLRRVNGGATGKNGFAKAFFECLNSRASNHKPPYYWVAGEHKVFSVGYKASRFGKARQRGWNPCGFNLWGEILQKLADQVISDNLTSPLSMHNLLSVARFPDPQQYSKTVLIISDSYAKYLRTIDSGLVLRISGGKFSDLAEFLCVVSIWKISNTLLFLWV